MALSIIFWTYSNAIAVTGQLSTACRQSQVSQAFGSMTQALSSLSSKTFGQNSTQSPQPMQRSISMFGVAIMIVPFLPKSCNQPRTNTDKNSTMIDTASLLKLT